MDRRSNQVFRGLNGVLTMMGCDRRIFIMAVVAGVGIFDTLHAFLGAFGLFLLMVLAGRWITQRDPQLLTFIVNSSSEKKRFDPVKHNDPVEGD